MKKSPANNKEAQQQQKKQKKAKLSSALRKNLMRRKLGQNSDKKGDN
jgi:hypothetical protein